MIFAPPHDHYKVIRKIGAGGMGVVYLAHDHRLRRDVAIKTLQSLDSGDDVKAAILHEARLASSLNHPNICGVYDVGESDGQPFIVMEFVSGEALNRMLGGGALARDKVVDFGLQVADALAHAHARGVVHRDLKSSNIMITAEGRLKLLDFGIASRTADAPSGYTDTRTGVSAVSGTLAYMAPETLRGDPQGPAVDTWALGVVLYEMASGRLPFQAATNLELASRILSAEPAPLDAALPTTLIDFIRVCLHKQPARRCPTGADALRRLEKVQRGAESQAAGSIAGGLATGESVSGSQRCLLRGRDDRRLDRRVIADLGGARDIANVGDALQGHDGVASRRCPGS